MQITQTLNPHKSACYRGMLQSGIGYLGGHLINSLNLYMHPGKVILGAPPVLIVHPIQAGLCALTFAVIDRFALRILKTKDNEPAENQLIRMAVTIPLSAALSSICLGISFNTAALAILISVIGFTVLLGSVKSYNQMAYA